MNIMDIFVNETLGGGHLQSIKTIHARIFLSQEKKLV